MRQIWRSSFTRPNRPFADRDLHDKYELPYWDIAREVYDGLSALLDEQVRPERERKALVRLLRYAGVEPGYTPIFPNGRSECS